MKKIAIRELREIIQECLISEGPLLTADDVAKEDPKNFGYLHSAKIIPALVGIMKKWNLTLIPTAHKKGIGVLGQGAYATVFDVLKGGKRRALKLTFDPKDSEAYASVMAIRSSLPGIPKSVLPEVLMQDSVGSFYFTLIEYLIPTPESTKQSLFSSYDYYTGANSGISRSTVAKVNKPFLIKIDQYLEDIVGYDLYKRITQNTNVHYPWSEAKNWIGQGKVWASSSNDRHFVHAEEFFRDFFQQFTKDVFKVRDYAAKIAKQLSSKWLQLTGDQFSSVKFPEFVDDDDNVKDGKMTDVKDPRARKLLLGLRWLDSNDYISGWDDLHFDNVMIRPSTGEFVASDVGNFTFS